MSKSLILKRTIKASREKVYDACTKADELKKWFAPGDMTVPIAHVDVRVGGAYSITMRSHDGKEYTAEGEYTQVVSPEMIECTWAWKGGDGTVTNFSLMLEENGDTTDVTLTHSGFDTEKGVNEHKKGWEGCLDNLEKIFS